MSSLMGKHKIAADTTTLADGDSLVSYLASAAGLLSSTTVGATERLDTIDAAAHVDGTAYVAGTDYLSSIGAVDESGNWLPLNLDASGKLLVSASVTFTAEHNEDDAFTNGDSGISTLLVRQDTLATSTSADGDYGSFKSNALGELYTHDTSALARLVLINTDTTAILADTATIDSQTLSIQNTLTALSKAEDAVHSTGDQGIQALAVRKDSSGSSAANGDYTSIQTWIDGSVKTVDIANNAILQQQVSVTNVAAAVPTVALPGRKSLMLQNTGANKLWIGSATVTSSGATTGIELPANSFMELEAGPAVDVYAVKVGATGNTLNVLEMA